MGLFNRKKKNLEEEKEVFVEDIPVETQEAVAGGTHLANAFPEASAMPAGSMGPKKANENTEVPATARAEGMNPGASDGSPLMPDAQGQRTANDGREGTFPPVAMRIYPPGAKLPEDGDAEKLLSYLLDRHKEENNRKSMASVLSALPPAKFWVPMRLLLHKDDLERLKSTGKGERFVPEKQVRFTPEVLKNGEGQAFYPAFVLSEDIPKEYLGKFQWAQLASGHCLGSVVRDEKLLGLVINPYTTGLVLPREMLMKVITVKEHKEE